jgi:L-cysteate sulfo-lyase
MGTLGFFVAPTPLEPAPRLAIALGLDPDRLFLKRDDLTGLGGGGNKARKLQYSCAAALEVGADVLVTVGAAQSNHARLTAAAGAKLGLRVILVLRGSPSAQLTGNLVLSRLFGATTVWAGDVDETGLFEAARTVAAECQARGERPFLIPFGGSSALAARAYADVGAELLRQSPTLRHVVVALGSGATMAGLVSALGADRVLGVDCGATDDARATVVTLLKGMGSDTGDRLRIAQDQVGAGYAHLTESARAAILLAARTEGVVLDPVYTGRAMAALVAASKSGDIAPDETTVFVHTGGLPGLYGHPEAVDWIQTLEPQPGHN